MGANPSFRASAIVIKIIEGWWDRVLMAHSPDIQALIMLANIIVAAAAAWAKKYLVAASTARGWWCWVIRGKIARVLISSPIQANSQWELAKVSVVPRPRLSRKIARM